MVKSLEQQIETLIAEAPQDGKTPQAIGAIAPIFLQIAQQLQQLEYYILQSLNQNWQVTTLQNRQQPDLTKTVIYGYANLKDATQAGQDPQLIAKAVPIVDLLFRFMSLPNVDSLMLMERDAGQMQSLEIHQHELKHLIQQQLAAHQQSDQQAPTSPQSIHLA